MSINLFELKNLKPISQLKWVVSISVITGSMMTGLSAALVDLGPVPSMDELAGEWQDAKPPMSSPAVNSPLGSAALSSMNVLGRATGNYPPITFETINEVSINNETPSFSRLRWFPYQIEREGVTKNLKILSRVRMHNQQQAILIELTVTNPGTTPQPCDISLQSGAYGMPNKPWGWKMPGVAPVPYASSVDNGVGTFFKSDAGTTPRSVEVAKKWGILDTSNLKHAIAFTEPPDSLTAEKDKTIHHGWGTPKDTVCAKWKGTLAPGASRVLHFVFAIGKGDADAVPLAKSCAEGFDAHFAQIKAYWQNTFQAMFTPNNGIFSGHLPVLVTSDPAMRRVYYMSAVSLLSVMRTSLPHVPRAYVGNSPGYNSIGLYYWDARELAMTLAMLDPAMLKKFVTDAIANDPGRGNMQELITGASKGGWYSANHFSVFILANDYLNVTRNTAFLQEEINGKKVIDHLESIATFWKSRVRTGRTLADYGHAGNLLECVPTYINEVPSFNAANVWMMRRVAAIRESMGNKAAADQLNADADKLLKAVLGLYEPGKGVWSSIHKDGTRVEMRHVLDFATIGQTIPEDLTPTMRKEMTAFVRDELITDHWMRAQSLSDVAAEKSNRPDHGPMGAFSAWPAETLRVLWGFGEKSLALDFLHKVETSTYEGPFSQTRELMGKTKDAKARITARGEQTYNAVCGVGFIDAVIGGFFDWHPDFLKPSADAKTAGSNTANRLINVPDGTKVINLAD